MGDKTRGLFEKFTVVRNDGTSAAGMKHDGCIYFVLDVTHDPFADEALRVYAQQCKREYPLLAEDITSLRMSKKPTTMSVATKCDGTHAGPRCADPAEEIKP
jgi:hypothetical protein